MHILDLRTVTTAPIHEYESVGAQAAMLAEGRGVSHIHWLRFGPGGVIGPHPAGPGQLLIPLDGAGWVAGQDGERHSIARGQVAFIRAGEVHSKGSGEGMSAVMLQLATLAEPRP